MSRQLAIPLPLQPEIKCESCGADLRGAINRVPTPTGHKCFPCAHGLTQSKVFQKGLPLA